MDLPASDSQSEQAICRGCSRYYTTPSNQDCAASCHHELCLDCFGRVAQNSRKLAPIELEWRSTQSWRCSSCNQSLKIGITKYYPQGSELYHIEELCANLGHSKPLLEAIILLRNKNGLGWPVIADLLKRALRNRGRLLSQIKGTVGQTILHYASMNGYSLGCIEMILKTAEDDAWTLVCMLDDYQQSSLFFAVRSIIIEKNSAHEALTIIQALLATAPNKSAAWQLITQKNYVQCSALELACSYKGRGDSWINQTALMNILQHLESYQPKD
jgi:hypothetical protein